MTSAAKRRAPSRYSARSRAGGALSTHQVTPRSWSRASSSRTALASYCSVNENGWKQMSLGAGRPCSLGVGVEVCESFGEVVDRREQRSSHGARRGGRVRERNPALAAFGRPPDRGACCCRRSRSAGAAAAAAAGASSCRACGSAGPRPRPRPRSQTRPHHVDRLVGELVALVEVDAERGELGLEVAGRDPEDHAAPRQHVEAEHRLRGQQRVAVRRARGCASARAAGWSPRPRTTSATNGSSAWCPPPASHFESGAGWSVTKHASKPASLDAAPRTPSPRRR